MRLLTLAAALALPLSLSACFGGKTPATLLTLTPATPSATFERTAAASDAVSIELPIAGRDIRQVRVPVLETAGQVTYVKDLQYLETPDRLFQQLLSETVKRVTGRVVIDPRQAGIDPGTRVSGVLQRFGVDSATGQVIVTYDATATRGATVQTRRFTATAPADGTAASVGPAINAAANDVANQVAKWIGG
ncbi:ABC-type transport auxiliary lipoprotein family protein [Sphingomonas glaciei]|uniref:ABC transporter n=1 Tax=Sphingomonas glaciei TaxID=2938948 RepID=A0ABY5MST1_9SPHN|nr:ABC transporter [Sphingomonas glaciei]UUR07565.1 ABC transporter [Sphingomonas glaciei]